MEFSQALTHLKNGGKIRRASWSTGEEFVFEVKDQQWQGHDINPFMLIKTDEVPAYSMFQPNSCEVLADDWGNCRLMTIYHDLKDKRVLVTGAARGIGRAQVQAFLQQGAKVTGLDLQQHDLNNDHYRFVQIDLRKTAELVDFLDRSEFDIVCNTAGILDDFKNIEETSYSDFTNLLKVNLDAMFIVTKQLVQKQQPLVFVNMSSYAGLFASGGGISYTTSKHAINGLTKEIAFEYGRFGVRANAIAPCLVKTEMAQADFETGLNVKLAQETVFNRYAEPEEIADLTLFLASDSSKYITGQVINIDGGYSLGKSIEL